VVVFEHVNDEGRRLMRLARGYLLIFGLGVAVLGVIYAVAPSILTDPSGFGDLAPEALTDLRATYGGLQIGFGLFLVWTAIEQSRHRVGLVLLGITLPLIAITRAFGLVVDGKATGGLVAALMFETLASAATWFILSKGSEPSSAGRERDEPAHDRGGADQP
jgi:hypothetical protein